MRTVTERLDSLDWASADAREAFDAGLAHAEDLQTRMGVEIGDPAAFALQWMQAAATMRLARVMEQPVR